MLDLGMLECQLLFSSLNLAHLKFDHPWELGIYNIPLIWKYQTVFVDPTVDTVTWSRNILERRCVFSFWLKSPRNTQTLTVNTRPTQMILEWVESRSVCWGLHFPGLSFKSIGQVTGVSKPNFANFVQINVDIEWPDLSIFTRILSVSKTASFKQTKLGKGVTIRVPHSVFNPAVLSIRIYSRVIEESNLEVIYTYTERQKKCEFLEDIQLIYRYCNLIPINIGNLFAFWHIYALHCHALLAVWILRFFQHEENQSQQMCI